MTDDTPMDTIIEIYTTGSCHAFAIALARRTGWPLVALVDDGRPYAPGSAFPTFAHVLVRAPDDRLLDVRGQHRLDHLKALYPDLQTPRLYHFDDEDELLEGWSGDSDDLPLYPLSEQEIAAADRAVRYAFPSLAAEARDRGSPDVQKGREQPRPFSCVVEAEGAASSSARPRSPRSGGRTPA